MSVNYVTFKLTCITPVNYRKRNFTSNKLILYKMKKLLLLLCMVSLLSMQGCFWGGHGHRGGYHHDDGHHDDRR